MSRSKFRVTALFKGDHRLCGIVEAYSADQAMYFFKRKHGFYIRIINVELVEGPKEQQITFWG